MRESTLIILKPNAVIGKPVSEIITKIQGLGYEIVRERMVRPTRDFFKEFYAEHALKVWFPELIKYMSENAIVIIEAAGQNAVERWRHDIDYFREEYGESFSRNGFHGSDSPVSAERELNLFDW